MRGQAGPDEVGELLVDHAGQLTAVQRRDVLIAASSAPHWREAADAVAQPTLTAAKLREITGVLATP
ncbi:hypothetical protein [Streptomyces sp. NPDC058678]|uniref:hypothetical protein n=1 Tax=Streptomyces sp. NPDC058678 TaxID=3346595 RepID=UPI003663F826